MRRQKCFGTRRRGNGDWFRNPNQNRETRLRDHTGLTVLKKTVRFANTVLKFSLQN
jgi:hypothetical protein